MNQTRHSLFLFGIVLLFLLVFGAGYWILYRSYTSNHEQQTKILFYEIQIKTQQLLTKLTYDYLRIKPVLIAKHREVERYLQRHDYDGALDDIYRRINRNESHKPFDIYITDGNLTIVNTTYPPDLGFNLSFAKPIFDRHKKEGIIEPCSPLFEKSSKRFMSYTDAYLPREGGKRVLQVSYRYDEANVLLEALRNTLKGYRNIEELKTYIFVNSGFVNDIILSNYTTYKPDLKEITSRIEEGKRLAQKVSNERLYVETFKRHDTYYRALYLKTDNVLTSDTYVIYRVTFNETSYREKLMWLHAVAAGILVLGLIAIGVAFRLYGKERMLDEQDNFVKSAMHEMRTPLNVITLNNELRKEILGEDRYGDEIESAVKVLRHSYEDMSYALKHKQRRYEIKTIDLHDAIARRVAYFETVARANRRRIVFDGDKGCKVRISEEELMRLVDNNLSNAVKYSEIDSTVTVKLEGGVVSFHTYGTPIEDTEAVFERYVRENKVVGGYGLGLAIVRDIAQRYGIGIEVRSDEQHGTTFSYRFRCHADVIPS